MTKISKKSENIKYPDWAFDPRKEHAWYDIESSNKPQTQLAEQELPLNLGKLHMSDNSY